MPPLPKKHKRKIRRQVRKEFAPSFKDLDKAKQRVQRQHSKEVASIQGATQMGLGAVRGALARIPEGLGGRIENQLTNELQAMKGDVRMGGRQQLIAANQAQREGLSAVRQDTRALRSDQHDATQSAIESMKAERRDRRVARRTDQRELGAERELASREAKQLLGTIRREDPTALAEGKTWQWVEDQLAGMEGVGPEVARQVMLEMKRRAKPFIDVGSAAMRTVPRQHPAKDVGRSALNFWGG